MINEHDCVVLTQDLPNQTLKAGDMGTVIHIHQGGAGYEVEFMTLAGETVAVATLLPLLGYVASPGETLLTRTGGRVVILEANERGGRVGVGKFFYGLGCRDLRGARRSGRSVYPK